MRRRPPWPGSRGRQPLTSHVPVRARAPHHATGASPSARAGALRVPCGLRAGDDSLCARTQPPFGQVLRDFQAPRAPRRTR